jgi:hypothetical protein
MLQRDRGYKLIVGDYKTGQGILIENLNVTFEVSKNADNKKNGNSASIEVYNLSTDTLRKLQTEFIACEFYCGYKELGINRLVYGEVVQVSTRRQGEDKVTQLLLGEGYVALNHQTLKSTVPPGKTVADVIEEVRKSMPGVVRGIYAGTNINNPVVYGYPLTGTPKQMLEELSETYGLEYRVDQNTLSVADDGGLTTKNIAVVLNKNTGLIELPYFVSPPVTKRKGDSTRKTGVQFKALLNTDIVPGAIIKIESSTINGIYKVTSTRHYGSYRDNDWYVEGFCELPTDKELS